MEYLCVSGYGWGKGDTKEEAIKECNKHDATSKKLTIYTCGPTARINENGSMTYTPSKDDIIPELLEEITQP